MQSESEYLSNSRAYLFNKCRYAYKARYIDKLKTRPRDQHIDSWTRLFRGTAIHAGIESGLLGESPDRGVVEQIVAERAKGLTPEQEAALAIIAHEAPQIATSLLNWLPASDWEPLRGPDGQPMVEYRIECALPNWRGFLGYADLVALHKPSGLKFVVDWKSRDKFDAEGTDEFNQQFDLYCYALGQMGIPVDGSLMVECKPETPKRAPRIVREDVGGVYSVRVSADGRFRSTPTLRSPQILANVWRDYIKQAAVIAHMDPLLEAYRQRSPYNCSTCEYKRLCTTELKGGDAAHVLAVGYTAPQQPQVELS